MSNKRKGIEKERKVPKFFGHRNMREMNKSDRYIIARSAGSHSKIDVWVLDMQNKEVHVFQSKSTQGEVKKLEEELKPKIDGNYLLKFHAY